MGREIFHSDGSLVINIPKPDYVSLVIQMTTIWQEQVVKTPAHIVSIDFIEGLPLLGTTDCILVVMDKFSKYGHFLLVSHPYNTACIAQLFLS